MAYTGAPVDKGVEEFFETRRENVDAFLNRRSTLTPDQLSVLLGECYDLEKVKWFIAKRRGAGPGGIRVPVAEIVRFPSLNLCGF
jgi:hypothetical protein